MQIRRLVTVVEDVQFEGGRPGEGVDAFVEMGTRLGTMLAEQGLRRRPALC